METHAVIDPFDVLTQMVQHTREVARPLPLLAKASMWTGIGIQIGLERFVVPLEKVAEILRYPVITPVPGMHSWLLGLSNIRGVLLTITDVHDFMQERSSALDDQARVLVVRHAGNLYGLMVDKVFGLQRFTEQMRLESPPAVDAAYRAMLTGGFQDEQECSWPVIDLEQIITQPAFKQVSLNDTDIQIDDK